MQNNRSRKVFNCIVDDSALASGVKKNTRDGIRKWVTGGAIRLFVPLHTLEQLNRLKKGTEHIHADAREALRWLDEVTSETTAGVHLQEPDQAYSTWEEVEKHLLPETLLSMEDEEEDEDELSGGLERSLMLDRAPDESDYASLSSSQSLEHRPTTPLSQRSLSSAASPGNSPGSHKKQARRSYVPESPDRTARNSTEIKRAGHPRNATPPTLKPLFNHSLWLINQEPNSEAALASFILLTNDPAKQRIAQRFGIKAKRLEQLRAIIAREDKEYKNWVQYFKTPQTKDIYVPPVASVTKTPPPRRTAEPNSDDEDIVVFKRNSRGSSNSNGQKVLDPNEFSRTPPPNSSRGGARGGRGSSRGGARAGHHGPPPPLPAERSSPRAAYNPAKPIDPNSFSRPPPAGRPIRGGKRRLWEPA